MGIALLLRLQCFTQVKRPEFLARDKEIKQQNKTNKQTNSHKKKKKKKKKPVQRYTTD